MPLRIVRDEIHTGLRASVRSTPDVSTLSRAHSAMKLSPGASWPIAVM